MHHATVVAILTLAGLEVDEVETRNGWTEYWCRGWGGNTLAWQSREGEPGRSIRHLNHHARTTSGMPVHWWKDLTSLTNHQFVARFIRMVRGSRNPNEKG